MLLITKIILLSSYVPNIIKKSMKNVFSFMKKYNIYLTLYFAKKSCVHNAVS
jgi:hypothetical protein